jgi:hypothetical protein
MSSSTGCDDCGAQAPPADTDSALISVKYGWRLSRIPTADGQVALHWRCPDCWKRYKEQSGMGSGEHRVVISTTMAPAAGSRAKP